MYQSLTVRGDEFVSVRLTDDAYVRWIAIALPQEVRGRSLYLDEGHACRLRPDIVLGDGRTFCVAIDAEYT